MPWLAPTISLWGNAPALIAFGSDPEQSEQYWETKHRVDTLSAIHNDITSANGFQLQHYNGWVKLYYEPARIVWLRTGSRYKYWVAHGTIEEMHDKWNYLCNHLVTFANHIIAPLAPPISTATTAAATAVISASPVVPIAATHAIADPAANSNEQEGSPSILPAIPSASSATPIVARSPIIGPIIPDGITLAPPPPLPISSSSPSSSAASAASSLPALSLTASTSSTTGSVEIICPASGAAVDLWFYDHFMWLATDQTTPPPVRVLVVNANQTVAATPPVPPPPTTDFKTPIVDSSSSPSALSSVFAAFSPSSSSSSSSSFDARPPPATATSATFSNGRTVSLPVPGVVRPFPYSSIIPREHHLLVKTCVSLTIWSFALRYLHWHAFVLMLLAMNGILIVAWLKRRYLMTLHFTTRFFQAIPSPLSPLPADLITK